MPRSEPGRAWPDPLRSAVEACVGATVTERPLGGLSGRRVRLLEGPAGRAVLKAAPHEREVRFYRDLAAVLDPGVAVPHVFWVDEAWLLLEHLPEPLTRERWLADTAVMRSLAALHRSERAHALLVDPFRPAWTSELTHAAVGHLAPGHRVEATRALERLRHEADDWLGGDVLVSADPNPGNWGVRGDGAVVLFDWERIGLATPAVDVAITVPGLPSRDQLELATAAYLGVQHRDVVQWSNQDFTRGLAVVKTWTCLELLADDRDVPELVELRRLLATDLPSWVDAIP